MALAGSPTAIAGAPAAQPTAAVNYAPVCAPARPGFATCFALRRTDIHPAGATIADLPAAGYSPTDLAEAYRYDTSRGVITSVAIVDAYDNPNAESDLATYRAEFKLPPCTTDNFCFQKVNQTGGTDPLPAADVGWAGEISLDLDMVSAVCPQCHIMLVEATTPSSSDLYAAVDFAVGHNTFVSNSWGIDEYQGETNDDIHFNHPGKVMTFATGDDGHARPPSYPAASQYVVAVGGTSLIRGTTTRFTEQAWGGAGSGCSAFEPQPGWQIGPPDTRCNNRAIADVSAVADPATGVAVYDTFGFSGWEVFAGTSASAPIIAAVYALAGAPLPGDPAAFYLYRHFIGRGPTVVPAETVLNDVTVGSNGDCGPPICAARTGWDGPTGVGTPIGTAAFVRPFSFGAIVLPDQATLLNTSVSVTARGTDGSPPYTWAAAGLPPGLAINPSTGVISGVPNTVGAFPVTVTGRDANPASPPGVYTFRWTINPPTIATVPNVIDDSPGQAGTALRAAGLVVGTQSTVVDCNHLNVVAKQVPAAGTQVAAGSSVNLTFGKAPAPPRVCP
jgi:hypothetical protein